LPPIDSDGESDEDEWSSGIDEDVSDVSELDSAGDEDDGEEGGSSDQYPDHSELEDDSDEEMPYELAPRRLKVAEDKNEVTRLPIKLADGQIKSTGTKALKVAPKDEGSSEDDSSSEDEPEPAPRPTREDVSTGARFGKPAIATVLQTKSRKQRVELAKEQIASICQEILADPENSVITNFISLATCLPY
jgi:nucleolar complex protein 3